MPHFTTRVELHNATYTDYQTLHSAMEAEGFSRCIKSNAGDWFHLPTAEYVRTAEQILEAAKRAATKTRKTFAVLVAETARWVYFN